MRADLNYMRMALSLAKRAEGFTSPNPLVGAVIVKNGRIVGRGYHERLGLAHAEVNAIRQAGSLAKGATLYVTLEPCDHFGRTPPCTQAIIKSGIKRVVMAMKDPNPMNDGRGIKRLKGSRVKTSLGVLGNEARAMNRPYIKFITKAIPYVTVKAAQSLDGKIATRRGDSRWISADDSRRLVHELRGKVDAVMVGVNTVIKDNPLLLSKTAKYKQPVRIIVDSNLATPPGSRLFSQLDKSPVILAVTDSTPLGRRRVYERKGARVLVTKSKEDRVNLRYLLKELAKMGIAHILAEGGGELIAGLIKERLADSVIFFIAPKIIGGRDAVTSVEGTGVAMVQDAMILKDLIVERLKKDILIKAHLN